MAHPLSPGTLTAGCLEMWEIHCEQACVGVGFFEPDLDEEQIRRALIQHDKMPNGVVVRRSNTGRKKKPKRPIRKFTTRPGLTEDEEAEWEREQEGHLRWANRAGRRDFYIELSKQPKGWFWVVGEEGRSQWLFSGQGESSAAVAEALARVHLHAYLRRHGISERLVTTKIIDASPSSMAARLKNAF